MSELHLVVFFSGVFALTLGIINYFFEYPAAVVIFFATVAGISLVGSAFKLVNVIDYFNRL